MNSKVDKLLRRVKLILDDDSSMVKGMFGVITSTQKFKLTKDVTRNTTDSAKNISKWLINNYDKFNSKELRADKSTWKPNNCVYARTNVCNGMRLIFWWSDPSKPINIIFLDYILASASKLDKNKKHNEINFMFQELKETEVYNDLV